MADSTDFDRTDRPRTAQPPPVGNDNKSIHLLVAKDLRTAELSGLADDMIERGEYGYRKYGTRLQAGNGRNPTADLYEELLDALAYGYQEMEELVDQPQTRQELVIDYALIVEVTERVRTRLLLP
jgi:hypothetical protein